MRHLVTAGALVCVLALATACGSDDDGAADDTPSASESTSSPTETTTPDEPTPSPSEDETSEAPEGNVIDVVLKGGQVTPNGERVQVEAGEPITFAIDADAPGELHVHSTPDHEIEFEVGTSSHEIVIEQPGIVEVELHDPALVVVQLEVR